MPDVQFVSRRKRTIAGHNLMPGDPVPEFFSLPWRVRDVLLREGVVEVVEVNRPPDPQPVAETPPQAPEPAVMADPPASGAGAPPVRRRRRGA